MAAGKVNLPCFPDVVIRIRRALNNPETQIAHTVRIVGTEPLLEAHVFDFAGDLYGRLIEVEFIEKPMPFTSRFVRFTAPPLTLLT